VLKKAVGAACLLAMSDATAQLCVHHAKSRRAGDDRDSEKDPKTGAAEFSLDAQRTVSFAVWGFVWGPMVQFWFGSLNVLAPGTSAFAVFSKITVDQLIMCPLAHISVFTLTKTVQRMLAAYSGEGTGDLPSASAHTEEDHTATARSARFVYEKLENSFWEAQDKARVSVPTGWTFWPFVHTVTFALVPVHLQGVFAMTASATFNVVMSFFAFDFQPPAEEKTSVEPQSGGVLSVGDCEGAPRELKRRRLFHLPEQLAKQPAFVLGVVGKMRKAFWESC